ncbi:MAG: LPS export ABC transporter periplasmic protein LptC [Muribaculum sp.]|nr:LPS export ABC transporter periplasmic protein LptC [Muribaculum sp.]
MSFRNTIVRTGGMRMLPAIWALLLVAGACSDDKTDVVHRATDGDSVPTMMTRDVTTLISDSGITRYRITTPLWLVFDEAKEPVWRFPDGLFMEKFDTDYSTDATIVCDSATYFKNKSLWRLDGNVNILNTRGEKFLTQQLFWSQRDRKVYSDSFIHIERNDRVIEGYGFTSNERMTTYTIHKPSGIFPVSDFKGNGSPDSTAVTGDSTAVAPKKEIKANKTA